MLDTKYLLSNRQIAIQSLEKRGKAQLVSVIDDIVEIDKKRREAIQKTESLKAERNQASHQIAKLKKEGKDTNALHSQMKDVAAEIKDLDAKLLLVDESLRKCLLELPNLLDSSVPVGLTSEQNVEVRRWGTIRKFAFRPLSHDELGEKTGILDFKKAGEVTGARFCFLKAKAAALERALAQFMIHTHLSHGYEEIMPPFIVNRNALFGTGTLPKFEEDVFRIEKFDFFLIPTAEVPVTNYHRDEILDEKNLPKKYVAYSPCFRSEAGSYGKDTKGLKRQHQFNKVELVKFTRPEDSEMQHEMLVLDAERILQLLQLPYRVMLLCGGDTSFASRKTYDLEVWCPSQNAYMEISSCSNFTDFQARRANIRYRAASTGKVRYVHTINGSGLAVGRTLLAILENFQNEDASFAVPDALQPFMPRE